jgi:hypothetical protein
LPRFINLDFAHPVVAFLILRACCAQALSNATPSEVREFLELLLSLDLYTKPDGKDQVQALLDVVSKKAGQLEPFDVRF